MGAKAKWIFVLITYGFLVSLYLTLKVHNPASVVCSFGGACETVLSSKYAYLFGFPVSAWGMVWYGVGFFLVYLTFGRRRYPWPYFFVWTLAGLGFSLYLLALERFKIHAYCTWCLSSLAAVVIIVLLTLLSRKDLVTNE